MTKNDLSVAAQAEIADSLEDARDNHEGAMEALVSGDSFEQAASLAYRYGDLLVRFLDGSELTRDDMVMIHDALRVSYENCVELDLDTAAEDYASAAREVQGLI